MTAAVLHGHGTAVVSGYTAQRKQEVAPPDPATKFAVGDRLDASIFLKFHNLANALIFKGAQFAVLVWSKILIKVVRAQNLFSCPHQSIWAAQASDVIGAKRRP